METLTDKFFALLAEERESEAMALPEKLPDTSEPRPTGGTTVQTEMPKMIMNPNK